MKMYMKESNRKLRMENTSKIKNGGYRWEEVGDMGRCSLKSTKLQLYRMNAYRSDIKHEDYS